MGFVCQLPVAVSVCQMQTSKGLALLVEILLENDDSRASEFKVRAELRNEALISRVY